MSKVSSVRESEVVWQGSGKVLASVGVEVEPFGERGFLKGRSMSRFFGYVGVFAASVIMLSGPVASAQVCLPSEEAEDIWVPSSDPSSQPPSDVADRIFDAVTESMDVDMDSEIRDSIERTGEVSIDSEVLAAVHEAKVNYKAESFLSELDAVERIRAATDTVFRYGEYYMTLLMVANGAYGIIKAIQSGRAEDWISGISNIEIGIGIMVAMSLIDVPVVNVVVGIVMLAAGFISFGEQANAIQDAKASISDTNDELASMIEKKRAEIDDRQEQLTDNPQELLRWDNEHIKEVAYKSIKVVAEKSFSPVLRQAIDAKREVAIGSSFPEPGDVNRCLVSRFDYTTEARRRILEVLEAQAWGRGGFREDGTGTYGSIGECSLSEFSCADRTIRQYGESVALASGATASGSAALSGGPTRVVWAVDGSSGSSDSDGSVSLPIPLSTLVWGLKLVADSDEDLSSGVRVMLDADSVGYNEWTVPERAILSARQMLLNASSLSAGNWMCENAKPFLTDELHLASSFFPMTYTGISPDMDTPTGYYDQLSEADDILDDVGGEDSAEDSSAAVLTLNDRLLAIGDLEHRLSFRGPLMDGTMDNRLDFERDLSVIVNVLKTEAHAKSYGSNAWGIAPLFDVPGTIGPVSLSAIDRDVALWAGGFMDEYYPDFSARIVDSVDIPEAVSSYYRRQLADPDLRNKIKRTHNGDVTNNLGWLYTAKYFAEDYRRLIPDEPGLEAGFYLINILTLGMLGSFYGDSLQKIFTEFNDVQKIIAILEAMKSSNVSIFDNKALARVVEQVNGALPELGLEVSVFSERFCDGIHYARGQVSGLLIGNDFIKNSHDVQYGCGAEGIPDNDPVDIGVDPVTDQDIENMKASISGENLDSVRQYAKDQFAVSAHNPTWLGLKRVDDVLVHSAESGIRASVLSAGYKQSVDIISSSLDSAIFSRDEYSATGILHLASALEEIYSRQLVNLPAPGASVMEAATASSFSGYYTSGNTIGVRQVYAAMVSYLRRHAASGLAEGWLPLMTAQEIVEARRRSSADVAAQSEFDSFLEEADGLFVQEQAPVAPDTEAVDTSGFQSIVSSSVSQARDGFLPNAEFRLVNRNADYASQLGICVGMSAGGDDDRPVHLRTKIPYYVDDVMRGDRPESTRLKYGVRTYVKNMDSNGLMPYPRIFRSQEMLKQDRSMDNIGLGHVSTHTMRSVVYDVPDGGSFFRGSDPLTIESFYFLSKGESRFVPGGFDTGGAPNPFYHNPGGVIYGFIGEAIKSYGVDAIAINRHHVSNNERWRHSGQRTLAGIGWVCLYRDPLVRSELLDCFKYRGEQDQSTLPGYRGWDIMQEEPTRTNPWSLPANYWRMDDMTEEQRNDPQTYEGYYFMFRPYERTAGYDSYVQACLSSALDSRLHEDNPSRDYWRYMNRLRDPDDEHLPHDVNAVFHQFVFEPPATSSNYLWEQDDVDNDILPWRGLKEYSRAWAYRPGWDSSGEAQGLGIVGIFGRAICDVRHRYTWVKDWLSEVMEVETKSEFMASATLDQIIRRIPFFGQLETDWDGSAPVDPNSWDELQSSRWSAAGGSAAQRATILDGLSLFPHNTDWNATLPPLARIAVAGNLGVVARVHDPLMQQTIVGMRDNGLWAMGQMLKGRVDDAEHSWTKWAAYSTRIGYRPRVYVALTTGSAEASMVSSSRSDYEDFGITVDIPRATVAWINTQNIDGVPLLSKSTNQPPQAVSAATGGSVAAASGISSQPLGSSGSPSYSYSDDKISLRVYFQSSISSGISQLASSSVGVGEEDGSGRAYVDIEFAARDFVKVVSDGPDNNRNHRVSLSRSVDLSDILSGDFLARNADAGFADVLIDGYGIRSYGSPQRLHIRVDGMELYYGNRLVYQFDDVAGTLSEDTDISGNGAMPVSLLKFMQSDLYWQEKARGRDLIEYLNKRYWTPEDRRLVFGPRGDNGLTLTQAQAADGTVGLVYVFDRLFRTRTQGNGQSQLTDSILLTGASGGGYGSEYDMDSVGSGSTVFSVHPITSEAEWSPVWRWPNIDSSDCESGDDHLSGGQFAGGNANANWRSQADVQFHDRVAGQLDQANTNYSAANDQLSTDLDRAEQIVDTIWKFSVEAVNYRHHLERMDGLECPQADPESALQPYCDSIDSVGVVSASSSGSDDVSSSALSFGGSDQEVDDGSSSGSDVSSSEVSPGQVSQRLSAVKERMLRRYQSLLHVMGAVDDAESFAPPAIISGLEQSVAGAISARQSVQEAYRTNSDRSVTLRPSQSQVDATGEQTRRLNALKDRAVTVVHRLNALEVVRQVLQDADQADVSSFVVDLGDSLVPVSDSMQRHMGNIIRSIPPEKSDAVILHQKTRLLATLSINEMHSRLNGVRADQLKIQERLDSTWQEYEGLLGHMLLDADQWKDFLLTEDRNRVEESIGFEKFAQYLLDSVKEEVSAQLDIVDANQDTTDSDQVDRRNTALEAIDAFRLAGQYVSGSDWMTARTGADGASDYQAGIDLYNGASDQFRADFSQELSQLATSLIAHQESVRVLNGQQTAVEAAVQSYLQAWASLRTQELLETTIDAAIEAYRQYESGSAGSSEQAGSSSVGIPQDEYVALQDVLSSWRDAAITEIVSNGVYRTARYDFLKGVWDEARKNHAASVDAFFEGHGLTVQSVFSDIADQMDVGELNRLYQDGQASSELIASRAESVIDGVEQARIHLAAAGRVVKKMEVLTDSLTVDQFNELVEIMVTESLESVEVVSSVMPRGAAAQGLVGDAERLAQSNLAELASDLEWSCRFYKCVSPSAVLLFDLPVSEYRPPVLTATLEAGSSTIDTLRQKLLIGQEALDNLNAQVSVLSGLSEFISRSVDVSSSSAGSSSSGDGGVEEASTEGSDQQAVVDNIGFLRRATAHGENLGKVLDRRWYELSLMVDQYDTLVAMRKNALSRAVAAKSGESISDNLLMRTRSYQGNLVPEVSDDIDNGAATGLVAAPLAWHVARFDIHRNWHLLKELSYRKKELADIDVELSGVFASDTVLQELIGRRDNLLLELRDFVDIRMRNRIAVVNQMLSDADVSGSEDGSTYIWERFEILPRYFRHLDVGSEDSVSADILNDSYYAQLWKVYHQHDRDIVSLLKVFADDIVHYDLDGAGLIDSVQISDALSSADEYSGRGQQVLGAVWSTARLLEAVALREWSSYNLADTDDYPVTVAQIQQHYDDLQSYEQSLGLPEDDATVAQVASIYKDLFGIKWRPARQFMEDVSQKRYFLETVIKGVGLKVAQYEPDGTGYISGLLDEASWNSLTAYSAPVAEGGAPIVDAAFTRSFISQISEVTDQMVSRSVELIKMQEFLGKLRVYYDSGYMDGTQGAELEAHEVAVSEAAVLAKGRLASLRPAASSGGASGSGGLAE